MDLTIISQGIILLATAIAGITDFRTGLIYDWLTLPLIVLGIGLRAWTQDLLGLGLGISVFVVLYALYYTGKIGGGDVKLFTGIALALPVLNNQIFLLNVVFFAGLSALTFYSIYYLIQIKRQNIRIDWQQNKEQARLAVLFGAFILAFGMVLVLQNTISLAMGIGLAFPFLLASVFVAIEKTVKQHFFLQQVPLAQLEEDEIIASEFVDTKVLANAGLNLKKIVGKPEKQKLLKLGFKKVPVYRNAPRFGPFIFIGSALAIFFPNFFSLLFLAI